MNNLYYTYNSRKSELIEKRGVKPLFFCGDRTYYRWCSAVKEALEEYEIKKCFYETTQRR